MARQAARRELTPRIRSRSFQSSTGTAGSLAPTAPQAALAGNGFRWPVRGRVISGFGKKPDGERNDGINLAVPEGSAVKAAEDGTVIYAGNELKSYGNLVLIRHADGWVSAYAHNSELKVAKGDRVQRGQVLSRLDTSRLEPQVAQAEARVAAQRQVVARLHNGSRPEEIAQARANVALAQADAVNARRGSRHPAGVR